jgi:decaprenylphospho-beta-D-ribofuranose 2-oxidase
MPHDHTMPNDHRSAHSDHVHTYVRDTKPMHLLPVDHLEKVYGWGGAVSAAGYVYRPSTLEQLTEVFDIARSTKRKVTLRGAGRSYGDASIGAENIVLDLTRMNRVLEWDPVSGVITCEPGVTIRQLWQYVIQDGWWPTVVPGTMFPTLGGCLGMNIHGKNNFVAGPIGDHVLSFEFLTPAGDIITASREENSEFFYSAIGSFGMLGVFTKITLQLKRVYSGELEVESIVAKDLSELFKLFYERIPQSDYLVGWIDAFATGKTLGRAQIHQANYIAQGIDPNPTQTLRVENQELPDTILGLVPKSIVWRFLKPFVNDLGFRMINRAKYLSAAIAPKGKKFKQSHAGFAFLLDYVPNWKKSYGEGGLIQYQSFIPKETAEQAFREQLELCQREKLVPYLAVFKRHKPDDFLITHAVDGFSLALDFKITEKRRERVWALARKLNEIVLKAGGRFYLAKDATLTSDAFKQYLTDDALGKFKALKAKCDPDNILQSDLSRRLFAE